jgi:exopolysaccharide biosynthesis WecB/TagA/CpsF family protein
LAHNACRSIGRRRVLTPQLPAANQIEIHPFTEWNATMPSQFPQTVTMMIDGVPVDLCTHDVVMGAVQRSLTGQRSTPLAIGSVNLDHLHYFTAPGGPRLDHPGRHGDDGVDWVLLADGAPIVNRATKLTGRAWPRLTGADLLPAILREAEIAGSRVGFFGGFAELHPRLDVSVKKSFPDLGAVHFWSPERSDLADPRRCARSAAEIRETGIDVLVVGLGKPRQELWIEHYGTLTGTRAMLAFGAAADFLAGTAQRAPEPMQRLGLEWLHRLGTDPRRLAKRYLLEGPPELLTLRRAQLVGEFHSAIADDASAASRGPEARAV